MQQEETKEPKPKLSRLERLEQQKAQIENKIKAVQARENEKVRRARTRRLIQLGALSEKYFNCPGIEPPAFEQLLKKVVAALGEQEQPEAPLETTAQEEQEPVEKMP
jgi:hypothetical protein